MKTYFWNIFVWLTQGLNTFLGGSPDESTSSRLYRTREKIGDKPYKFVDWLFRDPSHCLKAYKAESLRLASWDRHTR